VLVLHRRYQPFDRTVEQLADYLFSFVQMNRRQRIELRNRVERLSEMFDWSTLIRHYDEAHNLALERAGAQRMGSVEVRQV
jgi:glycogen(starch) synthase